MAPLSTTPPTTTCFSDSPTRAALKTKRPDGSCRTVSFFHEGEVFYIPTIDEYTETERRMMWFENYEYAQIKANNKILIKMMKTGHFPEDHQYCYRGLEFKTAEGQRQRRQAKTLAALAIFSEQERQWDGGERDMEEIRIAYEEISKQCHTRAHEMALKDAAASSSSASMALASAVPVPLPAQPACCPPAATDNTSTSTTHSNQEGQQVECSRFSSSSQEDDDSVLTNDTETDDWSTQSGGVNRIGSASANAVGPSRPKFLQSLIRKTQRPQRAAIA
jgi:hypothetical protein